MQDAQASADFEAQQRQLSRSEGDRRAALLGQQRAAWVTLQAIERESRVAAAQHAVERLELAETLGRRAIAEEQASGLDVVEVLEQLRGLVVRSAAQAQEAMTALATRAEAPGATAVAESTAAAELLLLEEERQRLAVLQGEQVVVTELQQHHSEVLRAVAVASAGRLAVEQQETAARMALVEEQWASAMALPSVVEGRLVEAQAMAQASRVRMEELEQSLEEGHQQLAQLSRSGRQIQECQKDGG